jgi:hypothetical protein
VTSISADLAQHLVGRHEERVLLQDAADDHHRVCAHDVHDDFCTKLVQIVGSTHGVVVFGQDVVEPRFVFDDVVDAGSILERPLHVGDQPRQRVALGLPALEHFLYQREHLILIEPALAQIRILPAPDFELAGLFGAVNGDARLLQPPAVLGAMGVLDDVEGLFAVLDAFADEGEEHPVFFVLAVEERADVPGPSEGRTRQSHLLRRSTHVFVLWCAAEITTDSTLFGSPAAASGWGTVALYGLLGVRSDAFLWMAVGSMAVSATMQMMGNKHVSLFVGQWAPTFLILGVYNKLVKQMGSDGEQHAR